MKKSSFCFAYSVTSEWSSTPWFTPKGPKRFQNKKTYRNRTRTPTLLFLFHRLQHIWLDVYNYRNSHLLGRNHPIQPLNMQTSLCSPHHQYSLHGITNSQLPKALIVLSSNFSRIIWKGKTAKVWNQELQVPLNQSILKEINPKYSL